MFKNNRNQKQRFFIFLLYRPYSRKRTELLPFDRLTVPTRRLCCALFLLSLFVRFLYNSWLFSLCLCGHLQVKTPNAYNFKCKIKHLRDSGLMHFCHGKTLHVLLGKPASCILFVWHYSFWRNRKGKQKSPRRATSRRRSQTLTPGGREKVTQINICIANKQMHDKHKDQVPLPQERWSKC